MNACDKTPAIPPTSEIVIHKDGGVTLCGPDATHLFAAVTLRAGLRLYSKTKIKPNRRYTPTDMLIAATSYTGKKYKRGAFEAAIADLDVWIATMKAALPVTDERRPEPIKRNRCASICMTTGGEKTHPIVIDDGVVKEWIGFGWIELHPATEDDFAKYPRLVD